MKVARMTTADVDSFQIGDIINFTLTDGEQAQAMAMKGCIRVYAAERNGRRKNFNFCATTMTKRLLTSSTIIKWRKPNETSHLPFRWETL